MWSSSNYRVLESFQTRTKGWSTRVTSKMKCATGRKTMNRDQLELKMLGSCVKRSVGRVGKCKLKKGRFALTVRPQGKSRCLAFPRSILRAHRTDRRSREPVGTPGLPGHQGRGSVQGLRGRTHFLNHPVRRGHLEPLLLSSFRRILRCIPCLRSFQKILRCILPLCSYHQMSHCIRIQRSFHLSPEHRSS